MADPRDDDVDPVHVFDQTNGILADDPDRDGVSDAGRSGRRRRAGQDATTLGAHETITGAQGSM